MEPSDLRPATIFDVAQLAGVSYQTVSRVLNDQPNVRQSTKNKVEAAIRRLDYVPSPAARALATRHSRTIGLINTGMPDFGPTSIAVGLTHAANAAGYAVMIASASDDNPNAVREAVQLLVKQNVEAIVLIAVRSLAVDAIAGIEMRIPFVAVQSTRDRRVFSVGIDQYAGARSAVKHLVSLGHNRILHLSGPNDSIDASERSRGWRDELGAEGLPARQAMIGDWTAQSGYAAGMSLLRPERDFTAIFASNDQMALGLIHALAEHGVDVPGDVSVIGFDDIPESEHFLPPLTTMRQDFEALGREVVDDLVSILRGDPVSERSRAIPSIVARASTSRPRNEQS